jgi:ribonuclease HI
MKSLRQGTITGTVHCYTDGASRGNPGPSAFAFIVESGGQVLHEESAFIGTMTNNTAEYTAIINALQWLSHFTAGRIEIYSDSELVIRQLSGVYAVKKPHLAALFREVKILCESFETVVFTAVPRAHPRIQRADELCNTALDSVLHR